MIRREAGTRIANREKIQPSQNTAGLPFTKTFGLGVGGAPLGHFPFTAAGFPLIMTLGEASLDSLLEGPV